MRTLHSNSFKKTNGKFNFQQEIRKFFSTFPYVLLVKADMMARCSCYDTFTRSLDTKCPLCLGTGWVARVERHRCFSRTGSVPETLPRMLRTSEPSNIGVDTRIFYFLPDARPSINDLVVMLDFDDQDQPKPGTMKFFKVNYVELKVDERGSPSFYMAFSERDPVDAKIKSFHVYKTRTFIRYIPVKV